MYVFKKKSTPETKHFKIRLKFHTICFIAIDHIATRLATRFYQTENFLSEIAILIDQNVTKWVIWQGKTNQKISFQPFCEEVLNTKIVLYKL